MEEIKLSELCKLHLLRSWEDDSAYNDTIRINKDGDCDCLLIYFDTERDMSSYGEENYTLQEIIWVSKKTKKVIMFEGRLFMDLMKTVNKENLLWSLVKQEAFISLDYNECKKMNNVFFV